MRVPDIDYLAALTAALIYVSYRAWFRFLQNESACMKIKMIGLLLLLLGGSPCGFAMGYGISFDCPTAESKVALSDAAAQYFKGKGLIVQYEWDSNTVWLSLLDKSITRTLSLAKQLNLKDELVQLKFKDESSYNRKTVSTIEIAAALLMPGRHTSFPSCSFEQFVRHVNLRQNVVAWAEKLRWKWPNGGSAKWNATFWKNGTPLTESLVEPMNDVFQNQRKYAIGCYTATKLLYVQAIIDFYHRKEKDFQAVSKIQALLWANRDPLIGIEPTKMWDFFSDYISDEYDNKGKLMELKEVVDSDNFVPGDWIYLFNTDPQTNERTGYEGSNAVYLGRNKFDDYYNDNDNKHSYSFEEKLDEVWQWRNGVFSRARDSDKLKKLGVEAFEALKNTPENGGLLKPYRVVPRLDLDR